MTAGRGHRSRWLLGIGLLAVVWCEPALAQTPEARPVRRPEIGGHAGWLGGAPLGAADATLRSGTPGGSFVLFRTETDVAGAAGFGLRLGVALTPRLGLEGQLGFSRPEVQTSITADVEEPAPLTVVERIDQYVIEGGVVLLVDELRFGSVVPFASAGAGYLRQLHEGLAVVEHGYVSYVGGGVKHWFFTRSRGTLRAAGLRADARVYWLAGGYAIEDGARRHTAISAGVFVTF